jgi:hypothetical protein
LNKSFLDSQYVHSDADEIEEELMGSGDDDDEQSSDDFRKGVDFGKLINQFFSKNNRLFQVLILHFPHVLKAKKKEELQHPILLPLVQ